MSSGPRQIEVGFLCMSVFCSCNKIILGCLNVDMVTMSCITRTEFLLQWKHDVSVIFTHTMM